MRRALAEWLNEVGMGRIDRGDVRLGERLYRLASVVDSRWSVPWYNLGLQAKYNGRWQESLTLNARAAELDPKDEAAWWNLGIAATALQNWAEARRAWNSCGVELEDGTGEISMAPVRACVRLNPSDKGEVVWGLRLDPARIVILSMPLPESGHRFHDIVLNDGAENGTRIDTHGNEVPVFDELAIWRVSKYSTFSVQLQMSDYDAALTDLVRLSDSHQLGLEDWSTIIFLCKTCSEGNPGRHDCNASPPEGDFRRFGFGARKREDVVKVLSEWSACNAGAEFGEVQLLLPASSM